MTDFQIKPAQRQGIIPLIFLWGGTGGGKTFTALQLARGIAGKFGRVVCGDSENGRALICADQIEGGYSHIDFQPPFTPERYVELLETLEQNADVGVIDSLSHLWAGPDGVLEMHEQILDKMVGNDWSKREAASWRAWKEPKARLQVFKDRLLRAKIPIIGCFRGEEKSQLVKDEKGKSQVVTSKTTLPIFDKKLIFESMIAFEVYQDEGKGGLIRMPYPHAKVSHPNLGAILPKPESERVTQAHGAAIAAWCQSPSTGPRPSAAGSTAPAAAAPTTPNGDLKAWKSKLWKATKAIHQGNLQALEQFLWDEAILSDTENLETLFVGRYPDVLAKAEAKVKEKAA